MSCFIFDFYSTKSLNFPTILETGSLIQKGPWITFFPQKFEHEVWNYSIHAETTDKCQVRFSKFQQKALLLNCNFSMAQEKWSLFELVGHISTESLKRSLSYGQLSWKWVPENLDYHDHLDSWSESLNFTKYKRSKVYYF